MRIGVAASCFIAFPVLAFLALPGCEAPTAAAGAGPDEETINTHPATFDEAKASFAQIARIERADPSDPRAADALRAIQPSLDALNHLVARLEPQAGHVVSFYESAPGVVGVSEAGPVGEKRLLADVEEDSAVELYRKLAGAEPPSALVEAERRGVPAASDPSRGITGSGTSSSPSERPVSAASSAIATGPDRHSAELNSSNGPWYAANGCYEGGDAHGCYPDWWNGGYADYWAKTSFFQVAALTGTVYVQGSYAGTVVNVDPVFNGQWLYWWRHSTTHCVGYNVPGAHQSTWMPCWFTDYDTVEQRWDVIEATNQSFDWSYEARWNCNLQTYEQQVTGLPLCNNP